MAVFSNKIRRQKSMPNQNRSKNNAKSKQKTAIFGIQPDWQCLRNLLNAYQNFNHTNAGLCFFYIHTNYIIQLQGFTRIYANFPFQNGFGLIFSYCSHFEYIFSYWSYAHFVNENLFKLKSIRRNISFYLFLCKKVTKSFIHIKKREDAFIFLKWLTDSFDCFYNGIKTFFLFSLLKRIFTIFKNWRFVRIVNCSM